MQIPNGEDFYKTFFGFVRYIPDDKILLVKFLRVNDLSSVLEEEIKDFLKKYVEAFLHYKPKKVLFDYTDLFYPITDELNQWIIENVVKVTVANGLQKLAQVYPKDIITKLGLQTLTEQLLTNAPGPKRMLFDDFEQAYNWLLQ